MSPPSKKRVEVAHLVEKRSVVDGGAVGHGQGAGGASQTAIPNGEARTAQLRKGRAWAAVTAAAGAGGAALYQYRLEERVPSAGAGDVEMALNLGGFLEAFRDRRVEHGKGEVENLPAPQSAHSTGVCAAEYDVRAFAPGSAQLIGCKFLEGDETGSAELEIRAGCRPRPKRRSRGRCAARW